MKTYNTYLFGEVTYEAVGDVIKDIHTANESDEYNSIELTICSFGGFSSPAFALYDHIKLSEKKVTIKASGTCQSSALLILQAGHIRLATEHTFFMLHQLKGSIESSEYIEYLVESEQYKKEFESFVDLTIKRSTLSKQTFIDMSKQSPYITPPEAMKYKLIDRIISD